MTRIVQKSLWQRARRSIRTARLTVLSTLFVGIFPLISPSPSLANQVALSAADIKTYKAAFKAAQTRKWVRALGIAKGGQADLPRKILKWMELTAWAPDSSYAEIAGFLAANPDWPRTRRLRRNAERALEESNSLSADELLSWFASHPPVTTAGKTIYARALLKNGQREKATETLRHTWINGSFSGTSQKSFLREFRKFLSSDDHAARLETLVCKGRRSQAQRLYPYVDKTTRLIADARLKLRHRSSGVDAAIARIPARYQDHSGLLYERMRWRWRKGRTEGAHEILRAIPDEVDNPARWAKDRMIVARRLLADGKSGAAWHIIRNHGVNATTDRAVFADIEWMAGWIAFRYQNDAEEGLRRFTTLYQIVQFPISRARAAYWAGRAAASLGEKEEANSWFRRAAVHNTTYHGQLAAIQLPRRQNIILGTTLPSVSDVETQTWRENELPRAVRILDALDQHKLVRVFLLHLARTAKDQAELVHALSLAQEIGRPDIAVWISRRTLRDGVVLLEDGYPLVPMPDGFTEKALLRSIARQESNFYPRARSRSGALGVMQLMPPTAKETARKTGLRYSKSRLTADPAYNIRLGSAYLTRMVERFQGSYILAIASYNAGPNAVDRWVRRYGDPRTGIIDPVDWIELIPYQETRTYVQRVLANLQVFRARNPDPQLSLSLEKDLNR